MSDFSGYHACPCRTCFEIAIGETEDGGPDLCLECEAAGCDADGGADCLVEQGDELDGLALVVVAPADPRGHVLVVGETLTLRYWDRPCDYVEAERPDGSSVRVFAASTSLREVRA